MFTLAIVIVGGIGGYSTTGRHRAFSPSSTLGPETSQKSLETSTQEKTGLEQRSRDAIRQILANRFLQRLARQNLAYSVSGKR